MKLLLQIIIQEKAKGDYRAFAHCVDEKKNKWELRGYGHAPGQAADNVYTRYMQETDYWDLYGYIIE